MLGRGLFRAPPYKKGGIPISFKATEFIYDGISCYDFGLQIYDLGSSGGGVQNATTHGGVEIVSVKTQRMVSSHAVGKRYASPLQFTITFGATSALSRTKFDAISNWLMGGTGYKWLEIVQDDLLEVRYRCFFSSLENIGVANEVYALRSTVVCDGPYAYSYPYELIYNVNGSQDVIIFNDSAHDGYIYPTLTITPNNVTQRVSIVNKNDNSREFVLEGLTEQTGEIIVVDNARQILTSSIPSHNVYKQFNKVFFRLLSGVNDIHIAGSGKYKIEYMTYKMGGS